MKSFRCAYILIVCLITINCGFKNEKECNYVEISESLIKEIRTNDKSAVKGMMAIVDENFWRKGSKWEVIQRNVEQAYLFSDSLKRKFKYEVSFNEKALESYAVVTILLKQEGKVSDFLEVRFFHPTSPFGCKIEYFDFKRTGASNKVIKPVIDSLSR